MPGFTSRFATSQNCISDIGTITVLEKLPLSLALGLTSSFLVTLY